MKRRGDAGGGIACGVNEVDGSAGCLLKAHMALIAAVIMEGTVNVWGLSSLEALLLWWWQEAHHYAGQRSMTAGAIGLSQPGSITGWHFKEHPKLEDESFLMVDIEDDTKQERNWA